MKDAQLPRLRFVWTILLSELRLLTKRSRRGQRSKASRSSDGKKEDEDAVEVGGKGG